MSILFHVKNENFSEVMLKNISLLSIVLKGIGYLIFSEILCLFINLTLAFSSSTFLKIITVSCTSIIFIGLICNFAYNTAKNDLIIQRRMNIKFSFSRKFTVAASLSMPYILLWLILLLSKKGLIGNFYGAYKLLNGQFLQLYNMINSGTELSSVSKFQLIIMFVLTLIPFVSFIITYKLSYSGIDLNKIQYKD